MTMFHVIELTSNRIRKINRFDLAPFSYLQFLYLQDNLIFKIDDDVFYDMNSLRTLDLSVNAITKLPTAIFQLPSLRTLYLSQNVNMNIIDALDSAKPIRSPLEKVDISYTTDEDNINKFPDFGPVPYLILLNITGNQYVTMTRKNLVGFCNLQILANDNVTTGFEEACECVRINQMLTFFNVKFTPFICSVAESDCPNLPYTKEEREILQQCKEIVETWERKYMMWKLSVGLGVIAAISVLSLLLYCLACRKKCAKRQLPVNETGPKKPPDNIGLLNNQATAVANEYAL
nr:leucine-rich repeats and immunoglobulin-like domains protein 2 isoform X2 [Leptinotarsa decemlineata]XP_023023830.1 leucine-rich repeats and immunoglobulin-like domains protein 2 isoform X2 [Leptinotarsa decemlineata]